MLTKYEYRKINCEVMIDTEHQYETDSRLQEKIRNSIANQFIVEHEDTIDLPNEGDASTEYLVTANRAFQEARQWVRQGLKVAVLNFASNHSPGGAPFSAGAQEESLCRCSTLYPCLKALRTEFYDKHIRLYEAHQLSYMGNDDLIYTPDVCVFKTDEKTDPVIPQLMEEKDWYNVDVITCAAPELWHRHAMPADYEEQITTRIAKIVDVAKQQQVDVLILGAWGCGAFRNPSDVVARVFHSQLKRHSFKKVVFAMSIDGYQDTPFYTEFA